LTPHRPLPRRRPGPARRARAPGRGTSQGHARTLTARLNGKLTTRRRQPHNPSSTRRRRQQQRTGKPHRAAHRHPHRHGSGPHTELTRTSHRTHRRARGTHTASSTTDRRVAAPAVAPRQGRVSNPLRRVRSATGSAVADLPEAARARPSSPRRPDRRPPSGRAARRRAAPRAWPPCRGAGRAARGPPLDAGPHVHRPGGRRRAPQGRPSPSGPRCTGRAGRRRVGVPPRPGAAWPAWSMRQRATPRRAGGAERGCLSEARGGRHASRSRPRRRR